VDQRAIPARHWIAGGWEDSTSHDAGVSFDPSNGALIGRFAAGGAAEVQNDIKGVVAECGGSAMCATCHVYIPEEQLPLLPEMDFVEDEMLGSTAAERRPSSRLSCQIPVTEELDGLVVHLPEQQI